MTLAATGAYQTFQTKSLGKILITSSSNQQLTIRPDMEAWKPFNLRKVILRPVAK
ncbi:MAG: hypothetical protein NTZ94_17205 [Verrucomicrobia bacterium]|nr:hypothetical protein [Verrucomicrobiota bacterium]